jgi:RES domain
VTTPLFPLFTEAQLQRLTIEELKKRLRIKLGGMVRAVKNINAGNLLYRGVPWDCRPDLISQLSYPPLDRVSQLGRVNRPGQSVFYASCAPPGVFYELKVHEGDRIAFSEWEVIKPLWMHNLGYHSDALARLGAAPNSARRPLTEPIPDETQRNERLRKKVALAFTANVTPGFEYRYKQSVALTEFWCEHQQNLPIYPDGPQTSEVAGIVYPSLQMRGDADNVAFWPKFVHSSLALRHVQYVLVEKADYTRLAFSFLSLDLAHEFVGGTSIRWRNDLPLEDARRCHIAAENGKWVQRDGQGNIYGTGP